MQCITYDIEKVDSASFSAERIGKGATLSAILAQCVCFGAEAKEMPKLTATLAERVTITAERICPFIPGDAYLTVQLGDIELDYKGTAVNVTVESNTSWTVEFIKQWPTGSGNLSVTYDGSGDGTAVFTSDTNEGIDRVMDVAFKAGDVVEQRIVTQEGLRQPFGLNGGGVFRIKGGGRYGVLKEDVVNGNYNSKYTGAEIEALLDIVANSANG